MKILSNFDTSLRDNLYYEYVNKYGKDNILLIRRSFLFLFFIVLSPLAGMLLLVSILLFFALNINTWSELFDNGLMLIALVAGLAVMVSTMLRVIKRFWDYTMDFALITPHEIVHYNQQWILNRSIKTMDMEKVKTINVKWWWFMQSFFNFGSLVFLSEGDSEYGDLVLSYVAQPSETKKSIMEIKSHGEELDRD